MDQKGKALEKKVQELEKKIADLESKEKEPILKRVKAFTLKHKLYFIIILLLLTCLTLWEGASILSYRRGLNASAVAQMNGDWEEAKKNLKDVEKVTKRSLILYFTRKDNIENMVAHSENWNVRKREKEENLALERDIEEDEENDLLAPTDNGVSSIPTPTPAPAPTPTPTPTPAPTPEPASEPASEPAETYEHHDFYPIILQLKDNKGNITKRSQSNGYQGLWQYMTSSTNTTLKIGETITLDVTATDPQGRAIYYNFTSNSQHFNDLHGIQSGSYKWTKNKSLTHTISQQDIQTAGETLRLVASIKSEKSHLRFPGGGTDDVIFLDYKLAH